MGFSGISEMLLAAFGLFSISNLQLVFGGVILVWGVNFVLWGTIGILRYFFEDILGSRTKFNSIVSAPAISKEEVAAIVPAHNEELVIADTLKALEKIISLKNVFVVSDGSSDRTVELVTNFGVQVLDLKKSHGKAGALEACIKHFKLTKNFKAILLVDADTRLQVDFLDNALPFFSDANVAVVAGYAKTLWQPHPPLPVLQTLFLLHRDRTYFLSQMFLKYGQSWRFINTSHIVPGFASIYRTSVLQHICINPPGLVIEDFNMTFELHHKRLGTIAHHPSVVAYTQDPDNLHDYFRQISRWHLGLWQTIRFHGFWPSKFWLSFSVVLAEAVFGSLVFLLLPLAMIVWLVLGNAWLPIPAVLFGVWMLDYVLTLMAAIGQRRPEYLGIGLAFPILRFIDAIAFLRAIPRAYLVSSNGRWVSPTRRVS